MKLNKPYTKEEIRLRYNQLRHNNTMKQTCEKIKVEFDIEHYTLGDINAMGRTASPEQARQLIGDRVCPRCGEHKNLVVEPLGEDENGKLSRAFDIYCAVVKLIQLFILLCYNSITVRSVRHVRS